MDNRVKSDLGSMTLGEIVELMEKQNIKNYSALAKHQGVSRQRVHQIIKEKENTFVKRSFLDKI